MHHDYIDQFSARQNRYSAKNMAKPVPFTCFAPDAGAVSIVGDFNLKVYPPASG